MPPKKKAATPKQGTDLKNKISSKDTSPNSAKNEQTKSNYNIFILNVQTGGVQSILREFIAQVKDRKRRVVVPIVIEEVEKEISLEKGETKTVLKSTEHSDEQSNVLSYHPTSEEIFQATKIKIAKYIEENDSLLTKLSSIKKLDLLHYWKEQDERIVKPKSKKNAKNGKSRKSVVSSNDIKIKNKNKERNAKNEKRNSPILFDAGNDNHKLKPILKIELQAKVISPFYPGNQVSSVLQKFVEDHPEDGPLLYIIIVGSVSQDFCLNLLRENYPLIAIISLCPKIESTNYSFKSVGDSIELNDETKGTYLANLDFPCVSKCETAEKREYIVNELCWLMYDVITLKRQHANYLSRATEINVAEKSTGVYKPNIHEDISEKLTEIDVVPLYLNNLLSTVVNIVDTATDNKSAHSGSSTQYKNKLPVPLFTFHGKEITEYRNSILTNALANQSYSSQYYLKYMELINEFSVLKSIWNEVDCNKNKQRFSWSPSATSGSRLGSKSFVTSDCKVSYIEVFSRDAMIQRFHDLYIHYDFHYLKHSPEKDELDICFYNSTNQYHEESEIFYIPTKLCFRDYCKYVAEEIKNWTKEQENIYEDQKMRKTILQKQTKIIQFEEITDADFVFNSSLTFPDESNEVAIETVLKDSRSELQDIPTSLLMDVKLNERTEPQKQKLFTVYNIGDMRYQIISTKAKFKTPGGSVQLLEDKYTSGKTLNRVDMDYYGDHILYNHLYPSSNSSIAMKIQCSNATFINFRLPLSRTKPNLEMEKFPPVSVPQLLSSKNQTELSYIWPTGLEIRTVHDDETGELLGIEQRAKQNTSSEIKRMYFINGTVAINYEGGFVVILTPSGVIYETTQFDETNIDTITTYKEDGYTDAMKKNHIKYFFEMVALEHLKCDISKEKYKFITPDGYAFETVGRALARENKKLHLAEWCDFEWEEYYSMLEGGIKTRLVGNKYDVYFQNGTLISTTTNEEEIFESTPTDEKASLANFDLRTESKNDTSAVNITGNLVNKILGYASEERYTTCERTYLIQHENYATVNFDKDQIKISCPDDIYINLKINAVEINIKKQLSIECNTKECSVRGCKYRDLNNAVEYKFCFDSSTEPFLRVKSGLDAELTVNQNGSRLHASKSGRGIPKFHNLKDKHIVVNRNLEGYEIHNGSDIKAIIERAECAKFITLQSYESVVILHPIQPFNEHFEMRVPGLENFLKKFVQKGQMCVPLTLPAEAASTLLPNLMTIRYPSTAKGRSTTSSSLDGVDCEQEDSIMSNIKFLQQEAKIALDSYLAKITQKEDLTNANIMIHMIPSISTKHKALLDGIKRCRRRTLIYQQMIHHNVCPKFEDFQLAYSSVANMDIEKYKQILNGLERLSPNASYTTNLTTLYRLLESGESLNRINANFPP